MLYVYATIYWVKHPDLSLNRSR